MKLITILFFFIFFYKSFSFPNNKYCVENNIFDFKLNISFNNNNYANISAYLPYKSNNIINCLKQNYSYKGNDLFFSNNQNTCLNTNLKKYNACPCPPNIYYNYNNNNIEVKTSIGIITLHSC